MPSPLADLIVLDALGKLAGHGYGLRGYCLDCAAACRKELLPLIERPALFSVDMSVVIADRGASADVTREALHPVPHERRPGDGDPRHGAVEGRPQAVTKRTNCRPVQSEAQAMKWIIIAGIILVAGCTERPLYGPQPEKTEEDFERDFAQCEVQAIMVPFEHRALTLGSLRDDCMTAKGWRRAN